MQSSLPVEPGNRNIKAADIAEIGDIAKIVETTALRMDARQHPRQMSFDPAIESDVQGIPGERSNVKSRSRLEEPDSPDIKGHARDPKADFRRFS
jgi:hypothetical protein